MKLNLVMLFFKKSCDIEVKSYFRAQIIVSPVPMA